MNIKSLMWVSEWRIEKVKPKLSAFPFKVTNGGVYTPADTMLEAMQKLEANIRSEMYNYLWRKLACPCCKQPFTNHTNREEQCLMNLAMEIKCRNEST